MTSPSERVLKLSGRDERTLRISAELWPRQRAEYVRHLAKLIAKDGLLHAVGDGGQVRPRSTCRICEEIVRLPVEDMIALVRDARPLPRRYEETDADLAAEEAWRARHDVEGEWHG